MALQKVSHQLSTVCLMFGAHAPMYGNKDSHIRLSDSGLWGVRTLGRPLQMTKIYIPGIRPTFYSTHNLILILHHVARSIRNQWTVMYNTLFFSERY
jgi:hypothetical protein